MLLLTASIAAMMFIWSVIVLINRPAIESRNERLAMLAFSFAIMFGAILFMSWGLS